MSLMRGPYNIQGDKAVLILSRRNGESFLIGDDIKITVLSQRSNQVRIGIEAPRELPVFREEVLKRRQQVNEPAKDEIKDNAAVPKSLNTPDQKLCKTVEELIE